MVGDGENHLINDQQQQVMTMESNEPQATINPAVREKLLTAMEMMKKKFATLLLGEDMSGGGKGVSSALALSNAITNLAASAFGEQKKLEPMAPDTKERWRREIDWLLSVTDQIVEFAPMKQKSKDGVEMDVMRTRKRTDINVNIPALRKLDGMLLDCLDNFKDQKEFYYPSKHDKESEKESTPARQDDKWWIPTPKVPPNGLSESTRRWLQNQKDEVTQVLKAAMAINANTLSEMDIPESYIETLPKNGRATLGDSLYKNITDEFFDPDHFLTNVDLSSEHKIVELKNKLEALVLVWRRKLSSKDNRSSWSVSVEKREIFEDRAEMILLLLKQKFPGIPQSDLDISKIQFNQDVGHAALESYSRIIESLAFTVLSRIEDVMRADSLSRTPSRTDPKRFLRRPPSLKGTTKSPNTTEDSGALTPTLLDVMGWETNDSEDDTDAKQSNKSPNIGADGKVSYIERVENAGGLRSPTARH